MGTLKKQMIDHMKARGYSDKTIELYACCVKQLAYHFMKSPLEISGAQIESFFLHLRREKRSESTIHVYYESLKCFYAIFNLRDRVPKLRFPRINNRLPDILSQNEVFRLLESCASLKYRTIFTLIYSAGLRVSEAAHLRVDDVDFTLRRIFVRNGKNGKDRYTLLADEAASLIKDYLRVYNPSEYLFYSLDITKPISTDCIQKTFRGLVKENGIRKRVHVHTLRHCFATHLIENGTSVFYVMKLLGHSNIQTTMIYLHMNSLESLNIVSPIDRYRFSKAPRADGPQAELCLQSA